MSIMDLYERIDCDFLASWIGEGRQEDLHLDFKTIVSPDDLSRDDRKNLATAMSGFANSDGGLIVWGVESRKDPATGVDAASGLKPIPKARAILSKLQSHTGTATSPTVEGVVHRFVRNDSLNDHSGFLITMVPASDRGPHMAKLGEDRYYKRSGDSFYRMEHFDIADMFGRRMRPELAVTLPRRIGSRTSSSRGRSAQLVFFVCIENRGRGLAKYPILGLNVKTPLELAPYGLDGNGRTGLPIRVRNPWDHNWQRFTGGMNDAVHSGSTLEVTQIQIDVTEAATELDDQTVEYEIGCEGSPLRRGSIILKGQELLDEAHAALHEWTP